VNRGYVGAIVLLIASWATLVAFLLFTSFLITVKIDRVTGAFDFVIVLIIGLSLIYVWYLLLKLIFNWARSAPYSQ
jgi:hypothetical protein